MRIAIVGCGYVAALYAQTFENHPELEVVGAHDRILQRGLDFESFFGTRHYGSISDLLDVAKPEMVLNLTNPSEHLRVSRQCIEAGLHVYSEKPLGMTVGEAQQLATAAKARNVVLAAAPCNMLSEAVQTVWKAVRSGMVGKVRLVYAEMDDGMVPREHYSDWKTPNGIVWPAKDEFETGCTFEHAGYQLGILAQIFGPAEHMSAYARCLVPDKGPELSLEKISPDFSIGCLSYRNDITARITCGIVGPADRSLTIVGDLGYLVLEDVWDYRSSVKFYATPRPLPAPENYRLGRLRRRLGISRKMPPAFATVPLIRQTGFASPIHAHKMDFARGVSEVATAVRTKRAPRLSADLAVHITEITERLQYPIADGVRALSTTFAAIDPMPWATDDTR